MTDKVFLFPGQSSWHAHMFEDLRTIDRDITESILQQVVEVTDCNPQQQINARNPASNLVVQLAVFTANHIYLELLHSRDVFATASAGLSLGEYNHLVHIGALSFADCLGIIVARGTLFDQGPDGAMAALFPVSEVEVSEICARIDAKPDQQSSLYVSNLNSPSQFVVAGSRDSVMRACACAEDEYYASGFMIDDRRPMHTPMMQRVGEKFAPILGEVKWEQPTGCYYPNVSGEELAPQQYGKIAELLRRHVVEPVQWIKTMDNLFARFAEARFVEVGPRTVIHDLLSPKWHSFRRRHTAARDHSVAEHFKKVTDELR